MSAACGGQSGSGSDNAGTTSPAATTAGSEAGAIDYPRNVKHESGTTTIESKPVRIVDISYHGVWPMLDLGTTPVAYHMDKERVSDFEALAAEIGTELDFVDIAGGSVSLEAVAAADPDLIVGTAVYTKDIRKELQAIAPLVDIPGGANGGWRRNLEILGDVLDKQDAAAALIKDTEAEIASIGSSANLEGSTVAVIYGGIYEGSIYACQDPTYAPTELVLALGLKMTPEVTGLDGEVCTGISLEKTTQILGSTDYIVLVSADTKPDDLLANPIVSRLPAIASGRYHVVPPGTLGRAYDVFSPSLREVVLPDLRRMVKTFAAADGN